MSLKLFAEEKLFELNEAVRELLINEGMRIHHKPLRDLLKRYGAVADENKRTVRFSGKMIDDICEEQKGYAQRNDVFNTKAGEYSPMVNDSIPFVYDNVNCRKRYANENDALESLKVQHMIEQIKNVRVPTIISGIPGYIEPLIRYRKSFDITNKKTAPVGFWDDRLIPYFKELDIIAGAEEPSFFSANMVISPMIIDEPTGRKIITNAKEGYVNRGATPMTTGGGNSPITVEGTAIIAAAEILGMALVLDIVNNHYGIENSNKITGFCVTGTMDMKTLQGVFSSPEAVLQDILVYELFRTLYSATIQFNPDYTDARLPGMQCVLERVMKYSACTYTGSTEYIENFSLGNLLTCTVHSPTQMMIDLEIGKALHKFFCHKQIVATVDVMDEIRSVLSSEEHSFMLTDLTISHYKDNFYSFISNRSAWEDKGILDGEKEIIRQADNRYQMLLDAYEPIEIDKNKLDAMDVVIKRAKEELI